MMLFATIPAEFWTALVGLMVTLNMILQWWFKRELKADVVKGNDLTTEALCQSRANSQVLRMVKDESGAARTEAATAKVEAKMMRAEVKQAMADHDDRPTPPTRRDPQ